MLGVCLTEKPTHCLQKHRAVTACFNTRRHSECVRIRSRIRQCLLFSEHQGGVRPLLVPLLSSAAKAVKVSTPWLRWCLAVARTWGLVVWRLVEQGPSAQLLQGS